MGRHKYRKRENDIAQNGEGLFDVAKNLTKKAAEAALKKGAVKLSEKAGRKLGESAADNFFRKTSRKNSVRSTKITSGLSEARVEDLYQSPENSGDDTFKILSSAAKAQPKAKPKVKLEVQPKAQPKQTLQKDSEVHKTSNQRPKPMRGLTQQEINENLNRLMNM